MTVPSDGVETMKPRNCLTSLRTPKEEGPVGEVNIKNGWDESANWGRDGWITAARSNERAKRPRWISS